MKKAGFIILLVGLLITVFTSFNFVTREKVVDVGKVQITMDKNHAFTWSPLFGLVAIVIGGAIYMFSKGKGRDSGRAN